MCQCISRERNWNKKRTTGKKKRRDYSNVLRNRSQTFCIFVKHWRVSRSIDSQMSMILSSKSSQVAVCFSKNHKKSYIPSIHQPQWQIFSHVICPNIIWEPLIHINTTCLFYQVWAMKISETVVVSQVNNGRFGRWCLQHISLLLNFEPTLSFCFLILSVNTDLHSESAYLVSAASSFSNVLICSWQFWLYHVFEGEYRLPSPLSASPSDLSENLGFFAYFSLLHFSVALDAVSLIVVPFSTCSAFWFSWCVLIILSIT